MFVWFVIECPVGVQQHFGLSDDASGIWNV